MGSDARLSCSSSGWAWLSTLPTDRALALLARQGLGLPQDFGPHAPTSLEAVMRQVQLTRERGYSVTIDTYSLGLSAMSAPVRLQGAPAMGVLTLAGPTVRFTPERMQALAPELTEVAGQLAAASGASPFFAQTAQVGAGAPDGRRPIYAP
jgi:DNA-binding IclR family transcriptional regulator